MTDFEMVSLLDQFISTTWSIFATYVSIVFSFLVVSYLVSNKLTPKIVYLVITLYTLVALWAVWGLNRTSANLGAALAEIRRQVQAGTSSLAWLPAAAVPDFIAAAVPIVVTGVAVIAYVGSIFFFMHQRNVGNTDDREWPKADKTS